MSAMMCAPTLPIGNVWASAAIGNVLIAKGVVTANGDAGLRTLAKGSEVFLGETISTASDSFVVIKMNDKSKVSLRPKSEIVLETFTEDEGKEEALFDLVKGGLRTISGEIGKKRPENYRVSTTVATIGIRGTDFLVRLCEDDCREEEETHANADKKQGGSADEGGVPKKKEIFRNESNNVAGRSFIECKPGGEIRSGLYSAVFEGGIFIRRGDEVINLEVNEALFVQEQEILCLESIPDFIIKDDFLQKDIEESFTLSNILQNVVNEQQHCEIPEA